MNQREPTYQEQVLDTLLFRSTLSLEPMAEVTYHQTEMRLDVHQPMLERFAREGVAL